MFVYEGTVRVGLDKIKTESEAIRIVQGDHEIMGHLADETALKEIKKLKDFLGDLINAEKSLQSTQITLNIAGGKIVGIQKISSTDAGTVERLKMFYTPNKDQDKDYISHVKSIPASPIVNVTGYVQPMLSETKQDSGYIKRIPKIRISGDKGNQSSALTIKEEDYKKITSLKNYLVKRDQQAMANYIAYDGKENGLYHTLEELVSQSKDPVVHEKFNTIKEEYGQGAEKSKIIKDVKGLHRKLAEMVVGDSISLAFSVENNNITGISTIYTQNPIFHTALGELAGRQQNEENVPYFLPHETDQIFSSRELSRELRSLSQGIEGRG